MCVRVVRWRLVPGGSDDFHERYLLTDRGGYKLGKGFDEEPGRTQPVGLLDETRVESLVGGIQGRHPVTVEGLRNPTRATALIGR
jgi:hypothetical protein